MGHNYRELQEYATKKVKFKQKVAIAIAKQQGVVAADLFGIVRGGICAALCMQWLTEVMGNGVVTFQRGKGPESGVHEANAATIADHAGRMKSYKETVKTSGVENAEVGLAASYGLQLDTKNCVYRDDDGDPEPFRSTWAALGKLASEDHLKRGKACT